MFVFHGKRCVVGRELVGTKTCGSTLSSACSRSFIAYLAKSAAVAYGEVDCSSPLAAPTITRVKQTAKSLFMCKTAATLLSDDMHLGKAFSILKTGPTRQFSNVLGRADPHSAGEQGLMLELSIFHLGIIERIMKPPALLSAQRGVDNERCHCR